MTEREPYVARLITALDLALSAFPDSDTGGPEGTGYKWAWDELTTEEQDWVKGIRQRIVILRLPEETLS